MLMGFEVDLSVVVDCGREDLADLTVEGTQGALVLEMPYNGWPRYLGETLFRLRAWGFRPVLAHPERNDRVQKDPAVLQDCLKAGAVAQITVASLTGEFGKKPERVFRMLLGEGAVSLLATDAHAYRTDGWTLAPVIEKLRATVGEETIAALVKENPRRLLAGEALLKVQ